MRPLPTPLPPLPPMLLVDREMRMGGSSLPKDSVNVQLRDGEWSFLADRRPAFATPGNAAALPLWGDALARAVLPFRFDCIHGREPWGWRDPFHRDRGEAPEAFAAALLDAILALPADAWPASGGIHVTLAYGLHGPDEARAYAGRLEEPFDDIPGFADHPSTLRALDLARPWMEGFAWCDVSLGLVLSSAHERLELRRSLRREDAR